MRTRPRHSWPAGPCAHGDPLPTCFCTCGDLRRLAEACGGLRRLAEECGDLRRLAETCGALRRLAEPCGDLRRLAPHANLLADDVIALLGFHKKENPTDVKACFREMLSEWLKMIDPLPSWEGLLEALKKPCVGHKNLAMKLAREHQIHLTGTVSNK